MVIPIHNLTSDNIEVFGASISGNSMEMVRSLDITPSATEKAKKRFGTSIIFNTNNITIGLNAKDESLFRNYLDGVKQNKTLEDFKEEALSKINDENLQFDDINDENIELIREAIENDTDGIKKGDITKSIIELLEG